MYVKTLKTVELRGVTVLRDGLTVKTRLGQGYLADIGAPDVLSMRNPWRANPANAEPPRRAVFAVVHDRDDAVAARAGRPGCPTGIPTCQGPTPRNEDSLVSSSMPGHRHRQSAQDGSSVLWPITAATAALVRWGIGSSGL